MYYSYKFARGGGLFSREKVELVFRHKGSLAAEYLSQAFSFASTVEASSFWYEVHSWLQGGASRKIISCPLNSTGGESPAKILARMLIIVENMQRFWPDAINMPPDLQSRRRRRIMPTVSGERMLWPDSSIVSEIPRTAGEKVRGSPQPVSDYPPVGIELASVDDEYIASDVEVNEDDDS